MTGDLKGKIDTIWNAFWSGGLANPLEVFEQITNLLFVRRLDDLQTPAEKKASRIGQPIESPLYHPGQANLRWSKFKDLEPGVMHQVVGEGVFPHPRELGGDGSTYSEHMKDARFTIPTPGRLSRVVNRAHPTWGCSRMSPINAQRAALQSALETGDELIVSLQSKAFRGDL